MAGVSGNAPAEKPQEKSNGEKRKARNDFTLLSMRKELHDIYIRRSHRDQDCGARAHFYHDRRE
jgi:hypothetical protein